MLALLTVGPKFTRPTSLAAAAAVDRPTSAANPSAVANAVDRYELRDASLMCNVQSMGQTDSRSL